MEWRPLSRHQPHSPQERELKRESCQPAHRQHSGAYIRIGIDGRLPQSHNAFRDAGTDNAAKSEGYEPRQVVFKRGDVTMAGRTERAILAGGCFWGMQQLIRRLPGVASTRVGYSGGDVKNATYRNHGTHAEAIEIKFDPDKTSFRNLLEFFFQIHDPTTRNRQGNDVGMSYRSAIFYINDEQRRLAEDTIADVDASGLWPGRVVTEIAPAGNFWEAEPEHQDYLERYPNGYTCHFVRPGWKLPRRSPVA
jgi:peptide-methionine (S)-S-oxide reductase